MTGEIRHKSNKSKRGTKAVVLSMFIDYKRGRDCANMCKYVIQL